MNKKTEYALIALKHIFPKEEGALTSAKEVCETYGTPFDATSRVLQILASKSWLISEQGAYGGYKIGDQISELSVRELCEIIEGPQAVVKCLADNKNSTTCDLLDTCNVVTPLGILNQKLINYLDQLMVVDLISSGPLMTAKDPVSNTEYMQIEGE